MINLEMMKKKKIQWPTADCIIFLNVVLCEICSLVIQIQHATFYF